MKSIKEQPVVDELDEPPLEATLSPARGFSSSREGNRSEYVMQRGPKKIRSLREIYEQIEEDRETNLFFLYADHEPLTFQEAKEEDCWRSTIKEEIHVIQKNET